MTSVRVYSSKLGHVRVKSHLGRAVLGSHGANSPNLWPPWAVTVMTLPAPLHITAGETRLEAMGGC